MFDHKNIKIEELQHFLSNTLSEALGMEVVEIGSDFLTIKMPVDRRTVQPYGLLNGGASMALAETVASFAGNIYLQNQNKICVGLEINGNHLRSVRSGWVFGKATAIHLGKSTQVWNIDITDESGEMVCKSRFTAAVIDKK
ncbi:MAG: hotdog fold thioesterase [Flavobacteriales bacterium]|nr:hotdog fold thioesterase [Flavobacteriales bacterium]